MHHTILIDALGNASLWLDIPCTVMMGHSSVHSWHMRQLPLISSAIVLIWAVNLFSMGVHVSLTSSTHVGDELEW